MSLFSECKYIKNVQFYLKKCSNLPLKMFKSPLVYIRRSDLNLTSNGEVTISL